MHHTHALSLIPQLATPSTPKNIYMLTHVNAHTHTCSLTSPPSQARSYNAMRLLRWERLWHLACPGETCAQQTQRAWHCVCVGTATCTRVSYPQVQAALSYVYDCSLVPWASLSLHVWCQTKKPCRVHAVSHAVFGFFFCLSQAFNTCTMYYVCLVQVFPHSASGVRVATTCIDPSLLMYKCVSLAFCVFVGACSSHTQLVHVRRHIRCLHYCNARQGSHLCTCLDCGVCVCVCARKTLCVCTQTDTCFGSRCGLFDSCIPLKIQRTAFCYVYVVPHVVLITHAHTYTRRGWSLLCTLPHARQQLLHRALAVQCLPSRPARHPHPQAGLHEAHCHPVGLHVCRLPDFA
jgi:hypothetical protein